MTFQPASARVAMIASPARFSDEAGDHVGAYSAVGRAGIEAKCAGGWPRRCTHR